MQYKHKYLLGLVSLFAAYLFVIFFSPERFLQDFDRGVGIASEFQSNPKLKQFSSREFVWGFQPIRSLEPEYTAVYKQLIREAGSRIGVSLVPESLDSTLVSTRLKERKLSFVSLSPHRFKVLAKEFGLRPLMAELYDNARYYLSYMIVRKDSTFRHPTELRAKRIAFVSPGSTSGYWYPMRLLARYGLDPKKDFAEILFAGSHQNSWRAVATGRVEAGFVYGAFFLKRSPAAAGVRIIAKSSRIPSAVVAVSHDTPDLVAREVLAYMNWLRSHPNETFRKFMKATRITGWVKADPADYRITRVGENHAP